MVNDPAAELPNVGSLGFDWQTPSKSWNFSSEWRDET